MEGIKASANNGLVMQRLELRRWDRLLKFNATLVESKVKITSTDVSITTVFNEETGGLSSARMLGFLWRLFPPVRSRVNITNRRGRQTQQMQLLARFDSRATEKIFSKLTGRFIPVAQKRRTAFSSGGGHGSLLFSFGNLGELSLPLDRELNYLAWDGRFSVRLNFSFARLYPPQLIFSTLF